MAMMASGLRGIATSYDNALFDLDGTLIDPQLGITRSIQYALRKLGRPVPNAEELLWCIGPPLLDSLRTLLGAEPSTLADQALALYRERFSVTGILENRIYDGIPELLTGLNESGVTLYIATSKPQVYAQKIVAHLGLACHFRAVYGSTLSGELSDKMDLIRFILQKEDLERTRTIMVGDRSYDILGAKQCRIASLGVTYGYGTREELAESGADWMADQPLELMKTIEMINAGLS